MGGKKNSFGSLDTEFQAFFQRSALGPDTIEARRREIAAHIIGASRNLTEPDFTAFAREDLFELLRGYDELFFGKQLSRRFPSASSGLQLRLSRRMTSTGGTTTMRKHPGARPEEVKFEIAVSATLLFNSEFGAKSIRVAGVDTPTRLDALQRIFEHELVHLLEMLAWRDSSCARSRFRRAAADWFGHRESRHQLMTPAEAVRDEFSLQAGDTVSFTFKGRRLTGCINRVNRRATILVKHSAGELFTDGNRYVRYYVPPKQLVKET